MDGQMQEISPHSTRLCPQLEPLPYCPLRPYNIKEAGQRNRWPHDAFWQLAVVVIQISYNSFLTLSPYSPSLLITHSWAKTSSLPEDWDWSLESRKSKNFRKREKLKEIQIQIDVLHETARVPIGCIVHFWISKRKMNLFFGVRFSFKMRPLNSSEYFLPATLHQRDQFSCFSIVL